MSNEMKALVTGAAGLIRSNMSEYLIQKGVQVKGIDRFMDYYPREIKESNIAGLKKQESLKFTVDSLLQADMSKAQEILGHKHQVSLTEGLRAEYSRIKGLLA